jgi:hypothetical protein
MNTVFIKQKIVKSYIAISFILSFSVNVFAQTNNIEKYWYYRHRLVNGFVKIGNQPGESLVAGIRNLYTDYVFDENYELRSIREVEQYIKTHKHLPGIPSAKEAESEEGVNLGELQRKMLEKIEEMMLYIIELKNENEALKSEIKTIKK